MQQLSTDDLFDKSHNSFVIKKSKFWGLVLVVLLAVVLVGVLSGVLSAKREKKLADDRYNALKNKRDMESTTKKPDPATKPNPPTKPAPTPSKAPNPTTAPPCNDPWCTVRLPSNVIPNHYNLRIRADVTNLKFNGSQTMFVKITSPTKYILFHFKEMNITSWEVVKVNGMSRQSVQLTGGYVKPVNEFFVIEASQAMAAGDYEVEVQFEAFVSKKLTGFYKSTYKNAMGVERTLLTTKFQPTDARKAYPCLDEPNMKATFNITMEHPPEYMALSNMPANTPQMKDGWKVTTFGKTVRMSTYLIGYIVSNFEYKGNVTGIDSNIAMRVYSSPPQINATDYSLGLGTKMTTFFEKFLKVRYPMPKLDFVAIPDYGSGATEHWGIITYRQTRLLYTKGISSESNKQSIATIVAHELAHLWFGNYVTCKWWNDLWVQEGMASYLEYYGVDAVHPDWKMMEYFFALDWRTGMSLDALASSHPISMAVEHPKKIKEIFDSITYNKGSSIIRMLDYFLGRDMFRAGLAEYLTANEYKGATSEDLWNAFSKVTGKDILKMMKTWTLQMGFPLITVTTDQSDATKATVTQRHFLLDPKAKVTTKSPYDYKWVVPFTYITEDEPTTMKNITMDMGPGSLSGLPTGNKWIKGNYMQAGFYRVTYSDANWKLLIKQLNTNHTVFTPLDRAGIIDDAFNLARAGVLDYKIALDTTKFLDKEDNYVVWRVALGNLNYLSKVLSARPSYTQFRTYMVQKLKPMVKKLGWNITGSHLETYKRILFLNAACDYGDEGAIAQAQKLFSDWMTKNITINSELKSLVYYTGVANGGDKEWNFVYSKFKVETNPTEKSKLQYALSATQKPWILRKWLQYSLDPKIIRTQDTVYVITAVSQDNSMGRYIAWNFARANWVKCMEIMTPNNFHVTRMTLGITAQFTTQFELDQVREFWKKYPNAGAGARARIQGMERIQASIEWAKNHAQSVEQWLDAEVIV